MKREPSPTQLLRSDSEVVRCCGMGSLRRRVEHKRLQRERRGEKHASYRYVLPARVCKKEFGALREPIIDTYEADGWSPSMVEMMKSTPSSGVPSSFQIAIRRGVPDFLKPVILMHAHQTKAFMEKYPGFYESVLHNTFGEHIPKALTGDVPTFSTGIIGLETELRYEVYTAVDIERSFSDATIDLPHMMSTDSLASLGVPYMAPMAAQSPSPTSLVDGHGLSYRAYQQGVGENSHQRADSTLEKQMENFASQVDLLGDDGRLHRLEKVTSYTKLLSTRGLEAARRVMWALSTVADVEFCPAVPPLVCVLLCYLEEDQAFCLLHRILQKAKEHARAEERGIRPFLLITRQQFVRYIHSIMSLLSKHLPKLVSHLGELGVDVPAVTSRILVDGLAREVPFNYFLRILTAAVFEGQKVYVRYLFALLKLNSDRLMSCTDPNEANAILYGRTLPRASTDQRTLKVIETLTKTAFRFNIRCEAAPMSQFSSYILPTAYLTEGTQAQKLYRPRLSEPSNVVHDEQWQTLWQWVPGQNKILDPAKKYDSTRDGCSITAMTRVLIHYKSAPTLIVIRTTNDEVLGGYTPYCITPEHQEIQTKFYHLRNTAFVFTLEPAVSVYFWSGLGGMLVHYSDSAVVLGPDGPAILIDADVHYGQTQPSPSFSSPMLIPPASSKTGDFQIAVLEVWVLK